MCEPPIAGDGAPEAEPPKFESDWRRRRRIVVLSLLFCAGMLVYLVGWGADTRLNDTIANGVILLGASIILGYLGFPVLDTRFRNQAQVSVYAQMRRSPPPAVSSTRVVDPDA